MIMGGADAFLSALKNYDKENIHPDVVKELQPYVNNKGKIDIFNEKEKSSIVTTF